jgi:hypothetical protein
MKIMNSLIAIPALICLSACGGSSNSSVNTASSLTYTNPTSDGTEWTLVKDTQASTKTRLVLNLVGPTGSLFRGIGFNLKADTGKVSFSRFQDANGVSLGYMQDNGVFRDLDDSSKPMACVASAAGVKTDTLSVGIFQKCLRYTIDSNYTQPTGSKNMNAAVDCSTTPVLQVALELAKDAMPGEVSLSVTKAAFVPNHGTNMDLPIRTTVRVGKLTLQ